MGDRPASRKAMQGGKSEQDRATAVANGHPGRPAGKCHRKYTAPAASILLAAASRDASHGSRRSKTTGVKVKWCGKSAPRRR